MKKVLIIVLLFVSNGMLAQQFQKIENGIAVNDGGDSRSINWVDINNDGLLDLFISNGLNVGERNFMYINKGNFQFEKLDTNAVLVRDKSPYDGASWADIDNDGDMDLMVVTWYGKKNALYLNNGNLQFTKVSTGAIANELTYSECIAWADYDKDGNLDAYVSNSFNNKRNLLYKGNGDSTFTKITTGAQVLDVSSSRSVHWIDIDGDRDMDLFVCNENNENENLYINNNDGTFTKNTTSNIVKQAKSTITASWGDYDNDGDLDVFLGNDGAKNQLFRNDGGLNFTEQTFPSQSFEYTFGSSWGDVDNDGDLDIFLTQAFTPGKAVNKLYINDNGTFVLDSLSTFKSDSGWSYGCAFGDINKDGFLDLAVANCFDKNQNNAIYKNNANANSWIVIKCRDLTGNNRSAIGAIVRIKAVINGIPVWQMREITSVSGHNGQNMIDAHFGLGNAIQVDSLVVDWPTGVQETYTNITLNQYLIVNKGIGLGLNSSEKKTKLNFHPNPVKNIIYLNLAKQQEEIYYEIFDVVGKNIDKGFTTNHQIEVSTLSSGIYFLKYNENKVPFIKE